MNRRPTEIKICETVGYIWCQTEIAAKNLRVNWLEASKTQEIVLFDTKLAMRRARTAGDKAVSKLAALLGAVAENSYENRPQGGGKQSKKNSR